MSGALGFRTQSARTLSMVVVCAAAFQACAARVPPRPAGAGTLDPAVPDLFTQATSGCAGLKTLTAEIRLSGRAGDERIRGTLHAGLAAPAAIRFEAVAPFGPPVFVLAGRDNRATLLLPRDDRVLRDAPVPELLERLTGLALAADDLRLILTGCLAADPAPSNGRAWPDGWRAVTVGDGITAYVRDAGGTPAVVAADHGAWRVDYAKHLNGWPRAVRLRSSDAGRIDLTAAIDQLEINTAIDERAFTVAVPPDALPMSIDELRSVAPLKEPPQR